MVMIGDGPRESPFGSSSGGVLIGDGRRSGCFCSIGTCSCASGVGRARMAASRSDGRTEVAGVGAVSVGGERMFVGVIVMAEIGESTIT